MTCERVLPELVTYHFGVIEDGPRREVEQHLVGCPDCLRNFLAIKRDIETAESGPRPSPAVLDRLRVSAAHELGLPGPRRWSWWERPLAFGFAGVAVLVAIGAVAALARSPGSAPRGLDTLPVMSSPAAR
jgi:anti-sigma factor RsiW